MSRSRLRRRSAALLLAAALLPLTLDAAHAGGLVRSFRSAERVPVIANPLVPLWEALFRLIAKEGSGLDPNGSPAPTGSGLDPDGASASGEEGGGLDPDGRT